MAIFRDFLNSDECRRTVWWRRRRDSNPRYGNPPYGGLANRWFQPLTHVSECGPLAGKGGYIRANPKLQPERQLFRNDVDPHGKLHLFAGREDPHTEDRPLFFGRVESGVRVGHGLGDEYAAGDRRIELEEMRVG